ncbi:hypothetical protein [Kingella negevensis]|uniref:hypothetical protein n=1 Tax=Kingella negevensis TaxID=1522312 RepID=UPI000A5D0407|nr:hypothetical protein [Kingella negevensis]
MPRIAMRFLVGQNVVRNDFRQPETDCTLAMGLQPENYLQFQFNDCSNKVAAKCSVLKSCSSRLSLPCEKHAKAANISATRSICR